MGAQFTKIAVCWGLLNAGWLAVPGAAGWRFGEWPTPVARRPAVNPRASVVGYRKSLRFNVYTFTVTAADTGAVRNLTVKAHRGDVLLTNFSLSVDGAVVGADVADLDQNRFPELYVYTQSNGSGSFGRVYAWQFLTERRADVRVAGWPFPPADGYMGHDSLWVERRILCRRYPIYQAGDANAYPTGGVRMTRYQLRPAGAQFTLVAE